MTLEKWNNASKRFANMSIPDFNNSTFLKFISDLDVFNKNSKVLDIGCGAGRFSFAICEKVKSVVGTDFSSEMIKSANEILKTSEFNNIKFVVEDFVNVDIKKKNYENEFDFVFAHRTPAIKDENAFIKMLNCSKKAGAIAGFVDVYDDLMIKFYDENQIKFQERQQELPIYFKRLFDFNLKPVVIYYKEEFLMQKSVDEEKSDLTLVLEKNNIENKDEIVKKFIEKHQVDAILEHKVKRDCYALKWLKN